MNFREQVISIVKKIPKGKVASYGQVAAACGSPRAARQVGWMLRTLDAASDINSATPWWRVINAAGYISIKGNIIATPPLQKTFLERDGVVVDDDFKIDMKKYRYHFPI